MLPVHVATPGCSKIRRNLGGFHWANQGGRRTYWKNFIWAAKHCSGIAATLFEVLENEQIPIYLVSTSEIKVSVMIEERHKNQAIQKIHTAFELDRLGD